MKHYYIYIMASSTRTLYVGVTSDLERRVSEHKSHAAGGFTSKYDVTKLVYCAESPDILAAIEREKEIKGWRREKKLALIEATNPSWHDLRADWYVEAGSQGRGPGKGEV